MVTCAPEIEAVFCDLDGVLVDFVSAALQEHGRANLEWPPGVWSMEEVLGLSTDAFWQPIRQRGAAFWAELPRYPWAEELVAALEARFGGITIATRPDEHPSSSHGKALFCTRHLPGRPVAMLPAKHLLSRPGRLLIDDSDHNVEAWRQAGGEAILFPRRWNALHAEARWPLLHVGAELARYRPLSPPLPQEPA